MPRVAERRVASWSGKPGRGGTSVAREPRLSGAAPPTVSPSVNPQIAERLREAADLLAQQGANPFRVSAYRRAAGTVAGLDRDLRELLEQEGPAALLALPGVGRGLAGGIAEMLRTGRWSLLQRLRGTLDPVRAFQAIPGLGPRLAERIHDRLGVDTLEALEASAYDGRLETVPGIGPRRVAALRAALAGMLGRLGARPRARISGPPVAVLLDVDREYRERAASGGLRTITPRRFNPKGEAWLPILHTTREGWHFTALFSNTPLAHQLGRTRDWVVVYSYDPEHREGQHTIVTETRGPLRAQRVVRGREAECRAWYASREATVPAAPAAPEPQPAGRPRPRLRAVRR